MAYHDISLKESYINGYKNNRFTYLLSNTLCANLWWAEHDLPSDFVFPAFRTAFKQSLDSGNGLALFPELESIYSQQPVISALNYQNDTPTFRFKPKYKTGDGWQSRAKTVIFSKKHNYTLNQLREMGYNYTEVKSTPEVQSFLDETIEQAVNYFRENKMISTISGEKVEQEVKDFRNNFALDNAQKVLRPNELLINLVLSSTENLMDDLFQEVDEIIAYVLSFNSTWAYFLKHGTIFALFSYFVNDILAGLFHCDQNKISWLKSFGNGTYELVDTNVLTLAPIKIKAIAVAEMLKLEKPTILKYLKRDLPDLSKVTVVFNHAYDFDLDSDNWLHFIQLFLRLGGRFETTVNFDVDEKLNVLERNLLLTDVNNQAVGEKKQMKQYEYETVAKGFEEVGKDMPSDLGSNVAIELYDDFVINKQDLALFEKTGVTSFITNVKSIALVEKELAKYKFMKRIINLERHKP